MARDFLSCRLAAAVGLAAIVAPGAARADLAGDAERLVKLWSARGASVERRPAVFLEHGKVRAIVLDRGPPGVAGDGCLTVALVAVRTAEFSVAVEGAPGGGDAGDRLPPSPRAAIVPPRARDEGPRVKSAGGAVILSRCGEDRGELRRVTVESTTARAALEIVVARSDKPLGAIGEVLPERAAGPIAPRGEPGAPIEPGPIVDRLARAERRARADGALQVTRTATRAAPGGTGEITVRLLEGCHRVEVMAEVPTTFPHRATDVDAEAHERDTGRVLARDRADVPDARLDFCVGEPTFVDVPFTGASGAVGVTLSDARWAMPPQIPARLGARARAGFAGALFRRHAPAPPEAPLIEAIGVHGLTSIPIEVEPGRCYLAAMALIRGDARAFRLSAKIGDRSAHDDVLDKPEGAAIAFCADSEAAAVIEVDARGNSPWWALAVWPAGSASP